MYGESELRSRLFQGDHAKNWEEFVAKKQIEQDKNYQTLERRTGTCSVCLQAGPRRLRRETP